MENREFFTIDLRAIFLGEIPITTVSLGVFLAALCTIAQFSFWGNYLPRVYPVHLRGTGESFAANIGGRLVGTSFAWLTATLAVTPDRAYAPTKVALVAAAVGFSVYLVGLIASFWLPEPGPEEEEDHEAGAALRSTTRRGAAPSAPA